MVMEMVFPAVKTLSKIITNKEEKSKEKFSLRGLMVEHYLGKIEEWVRFPPEALLPL